MAVYKKKSQNFMDEISEKLKKTIKKYNDIEMDNELSVINSVENDDSKSIVNMQDSIRLDREGNITRDNQKTREKNNLRNSNSTSFIQASRNVTDRPQHSKAENYQVDQSAGYNSNCSLKGRKVLQGLEDFSDTLNRDLEELEKSIEKIVDHDLPSLYK